MTYSVAEFISTTTKALSPQDALQAQRIPSVFLESAGEDSRLASSSSDRAQLARESFMDRRARDGLFAPKLFADPAWDMLLILYCASHSRQRLSITSVCVSAAVPGTTALRWIDQLLRLGMLCKMRNPMDARVTWLDLSDKARLPLDRYFDGILANRASSRLARAA